MGTTEADFKAQVDKLVSDYWACESAATEARNADAAVIDLTIKSQAASDAYHAAREKVQAGLAALQEIAAKFTDGDETT